MNLQIAICDDSSDCLESLKQNTIRYLTENEPDASFELDVYSHPDELLKACRKKKYHLFLLDIIMPMVDGIRSAQEIQAENSTAFFVFCTTSREHPLDAYSVNAIHYLTKPISYADFETAMNRFMIRLAESERTHIRITDGSGIPQDYSLTELLYFAVAGNDCLAHLMSGESRNIRLSMKHLSENLKDHPMFCRMGASYLLNLEAVRKISSVRVFLKNGESIFIPRGAAQNIRSRFLNYFS